MKHDISKIEEIVKDLQEPEEQIKAKLSVPLMVKYLRKGYTQAQIARILGVTRYAVNNFIRRHADELKPLLDDNDELFALQAKLVAHKAMEKLRKLLEKEKITKRDMMALNAIAGTHIEKYRLLSGKSTENIAYAHIIQATEEYWKKGKNEVVETQDDEVAEAQDEVNNDEVEEQDGGEQRDDN